MLHSDNWLADSDIFYYPECNYIYWIKLEKDNPQKLITEFIKLLDLFEFKKFIFLGSINKPWISKITKKRKDYKPLIKTLKYFSYIKVNNKFNGGIEIDKDYIKDFLKNFVQTEPGDIIEKNSGKIINWCKYKYFNSNIN